MTPANIRQLISCLDLTRLEPQDEAEKIIALCREAQTPFGPVAAVCVLPEWVSLAWQELMNTPIKVATVANFPSGAEDLSSILQTIQQAVLDGASEIDLVTAYPRYIATENPERGKIQDFIKLCKTYCGKQAKLKIILESGALTTAQLARAAEDAIAGGADFLKTSTGKIAQGASPQAVRLLAEKLKQTDKTIGLKISGGVRKAEVAFAYCDLVSKILGSSFLQPEFFRIGTSSLLNHLLELTHA